MARVFRRRRGDVLQPQRFTDNEVQALKTKPREWSGQYQQEPSPETGIIFNPNWWRYYKSRELPELDLVVLSVDCAFKSAAQNDFVSIQKWGQVGARSYLIDCRTEHLGFAATKAGIRVMQRDGRPASTILIEDKANGSAIIEELRSDPDFGAAVIAIEPSGGKESRAHAASTDVEAGSVYLPEDAPWLAWFLRTASAFPAVKHDDDVDAMTQFLNWRRGRSLALGLLDLLKRQAKQIAEGVRDAFGKLIHREAKPVLVPKAAPADAREEGWKRWVEKGKAPPCPHPSCQNPSTSLMPDARGDLHVFCKQCGRTDGAELPKLVGTCCGNFLPQKVSGQIRCGNCGWQSGGVPARGVSRADYERGVGRHRSFGRF